jgi:hypothetical protein
MTRFRSFCLCTALLLVAPAVSAQSSNTQAAPTVPRVLTFSGKLVGADGQPRTGSVLITFALYTEQTGGTPVWTEQQAVTLDARGQYSAIIGAVSRDGVPAEAFVASAARWLGIRVEAELEQPRIMLVSVPYALKAADADTFGGKAPADFVLSEMLKDNVKSALADRKAAGGDPSVQGITTVNQLAKFLNDTGGYGDSGIYATGFGSDLILNVNGTTLDGVGFLTLNAGGRVTTAAGNDLNVVAPNTRSIFFKIDSPDAPRVEIDNIGRLGLGLNGAPPSNLLDVSGTTISFDGILSLEPGGKLTTFAGNDLNIEAPANRFVFFKNGGSVKMALDGSGNLGIGTSSPSSKLHVAGSVTADGYLTASHLAAKHQDVAEWVDAPEEIEAGTVVIVDPVAPNRVLPASRAYDTRVAGAVSRQPGLVLGEQRDGQAMVAQSGRVRIKVDAKYGAVRIGDLLVTSPTPGCAMRSRPLRVGAQALHRPGTLLGKALEALPNGKGEILVLLTLQ